MVDEVLKVVIGPGTPADAAALARLHVEVWRETYRDLAPAEAHTLLDEARRLPYWTQVLDADDALTGVLIARSGAELAGVASFGPAGHPALESAAEIKHLYVRGTARGAGLGARLLVAALDWLRRLGCRDAALAVVRENVAARRFYQAMGGTEIGGFTDPGPLWRSSNIVVKWDLAGTDG
ncbi:GNAT family N-acetyltransferase [Chachezhania sediminis]|uniref:GNAT family N-acetyltransferase n=1 Tax=Chachezhania sediminis TaxID=2599291 RepID=UPI00131EC452|nr:GNAT family N-acetyltransferase [Chachezhania sediminis]